MVRSVPTIGLCCMLLWISPACAPKHTELLSEHGYRVSLDVSDTLIYLSPKRSNLSPYATLVVRVRNAQGQPVDGIPVRFSVESSWIQNASLTPAETLTRNGEARAIFQANTIGVVHVMASVDNVTREATITVDSTPTPTGGAA